MSDKALQSKKIRHAIDTCLPGLENNFEFEHEIFSKLHRKPTLRRKVTVGFVLALGALLCTGIVALAISLFSGHEMNMYENVELLDLLPEQWQQYDICHQVKGGNCIVGGFTLNDDTIAPMAENDEILYLDAGSHVLWALADPRLAGGLFDRVVSTGAALILGNEQKLDNGWVPAILKVSVEGKLLWLFQGDPSVRLRDYLVLPDERILCVGSKKGKSTLIPQAYVFIISSDGKLEWSDTYDDYSLTSMDAVSDWNGKTVVAGKAEQGTMIFQINADGTIRLLQELTSEQSALTLQLRETRNGELVVIESYSKGFEENATAGIRYFVLSNSVFSE